MDQHKPASTAEFSTWDDYFIPGTNVLRNRFTSGAEPHGVSDELKLRALEEATTRVQARDLALRPVAGAFDYDHLKTIHRRLFQYAYDWAGCERVGPVGGFRRLDPPAPPDAGPALTAAVEDLLARLAERDYLRGLDVDTFATELAHAWAQLKALRSFVDGNARAQDVFFSQLAEHAGHHLERTLGGTGDRSAAGSVTPAVGDVDEHAVELTLELRRRLQPKPSLEARLAGRTAAFPKPLAQALQDLSDGHGQRRRRGADRATELEPPAPRYEPRRDHGYER